MIINQADASTVNRNLPYYGKFLFKFTFTLRGVRFLNRCLYDIDQYKNLIHKLRKESSESLNNVYYNNITNSINNIDWVNLEKYLSWKLLQDLDSVKIVETSLEKVTIYTNDIAILNNLEISNKVSLINVNPVIPQGIKWLIKPKHKHRIYLKEQMCDQDEKKKFAEFINSNKLNIHPSHSTTQWLNDLRGSMWSSKYCKSSYFLEFDSAKYITVLLLKFRQFIGKQYTLETKPKD